MATAVNRPTDIKQKEKDVNQKLQLYGIYSAFANGKVPTNEQIDVALNSALASKALSTPSKKLSAEGQNLVADLKDVIEKAKLLLLTKNHGNLLQDFIWETQQVTGGNADSPNAPIDKDTAKQHGNEALEGLRTLGTLIISNGQFRKLLNDALILFRDMAGDVAQKAANKVNPNEDQLAQIDHPAEDNTWHDVPDVSKDKLLKQFNDRKPFGRDEAKNMAGDATQAAHPTGSRDPASVADLAAQDQQHGTSSGVDARGGAKQLRDQVSDKIPQEHKDRATNTARDTRDRTANYFKEKLPKERREQTIFRLKKMVVEIQGHQDYLRAVETLLRLAEQYTGHSKDLAQQGKGTVKGARSDNSLQNAEADMKTILERFANNTSMDDLFDSINQIYRDAEKDPELRGWFKELDVYIRKCLKEQGFILQDAANDQWDQLYDQGHFLLRERYRGHTDRITDEFRAYGKEFDADPQNKAFGDAMQKLFLDLGNDENGQPAFKPHLIKDLSDVILPGIFENIRYVPIPRIEYSDHMMDAIVENLVLEGDNLAPNVAEFGSDNYWRWGRKKIESKNKNKVMLSVSGIQADLRDVSFYVKKKQGFPSITDKGVADIFMGGQGFSFKVEMETADKTDREHFFKINRINVDVKHVNIKLKQSNHKLLFGLFKPLLLKVLNPVIQKVLEKQIKDSVQQLDQIAYQIYTEAKRAEAEAKRNPDPEYIQSMYQRYVTAAQQQFMSGKKKQEEVAGDKKVNVAVTQHDSMFKNIALPGGISSKATEFKELAAKGEKWQSPVFSIGSAKETSNLPKVENVRRKGGARGAGVSGAAGGYGSANSTTAGAGEYVGADGGYDNTNRGYGNTNPGNGNLYSNAGGNEAGFSNQVDKAFTGGTSVTNTTHTTLGESNPVLRGAV